MKLSIIILAAGKGRRMHSDQPKVLHTLAGRPLLQHVLDTARHLSQHSLHVVYGHGGEAVRAAIQTPGIHWVHQAEQLGTGHAVAQAMPAVPDDHQVLVLYGDVPLIRRETLGQLLQAPGDGLALLTAQLPDPSGYGRIVRDHRGEVRCIVEEKDADHAVRQICEINTGILRAPASWLRHKLAQLRNHNAQGEYYLTDIIGMAVADGLSIHSFSPSDLYEVSGVNDHRQLAELEREYQRLQAEHWMSEGVSLRDPARFDLRGTLQVGRDVSIDIDVILEGQVKLGDRVRIGPFVQIRDVEIGDDVEILAHCVLDSAVIEAGCKIGPFARIRPETHLARDVHIGNFVEVKKSQVGSGSKINHLSYIGDAEIGSAVNIGAGTITCNYDGAYKHKTVIGDRVFVGSDTQLVAPVTVGDGATIGAGSTITCDVPPEQLTLSRSPQKTIQNWQRPVKKPQKT